MSRELIVLLRVWELPWKMASDHAQMWLTIHAKAISQLMQHIQGISSINKSPFTRSTYVAGWSTEKHGFYALKVQWVSNKQALREIQLIKKINDLCAVRPPPGALGPQAPPVPLEHGAAFP